MVLNKSFLRKRTAVNETHIASIEKELEGLQAWKTDLENRYKIRNDEVEAHFVKNEEKFDEFEQVVRT